ncbi:50S ribosomal protein L11 methyltransferase [Thiomonas sp.]|jgi:ribosomal protein L11 methyltransferase|uniref:50S ribosomal protein L11 methyltransferase n=1 Tax=Thiomonas sp. TaxID=2047785 RepID=UPI0026079D98|nr:50S ribosomal protein L11 methyltransferase [Thiomonas sp.]
MPYREVLIAAGQDLALRLSDALLELGALSVDVEDRLAGSEQERALFGEPGMEQPRAAWSDNLVRALFADESGADAALLGLLADGVLPDLQGVRQREVAEQDWVRLTQSQFQPVCVDERLWIVPSWHETPAGASMVLRLDPGLAFGTGTHPTTQLCLRWLLRQGSLRERQVLDYGCGSGILALGAALLGVEAVDAVDIDPDAVQATRLNAEANGLRLRHVCHVDELPAQRYDVVVANILASPLRLLAPVLAARARPGGQLVLSGILERQAEELIEVYAPHASLSVWAELDGWVCLAGPVRG